MTKTRVSIVALLAALTTHAAAHAGFCCPGCQLMRGERLAERIARSSLVVHGNFSNPRQVVEPGPNDPTSLTDMRVVKVIKSHPVLKDKLNYAVSGYVTAAKEKPAEYVVFADVKEKQIVPYDGIPVETPDVVEYMKGAVDAQKLPASDRIGFFFKYLDHANEDIARDAYMECSSPSYAEVVSAKKHFDPEKAVKWLKDKKTQPYKVGFLGMVLGICGRTADAPLLREFIVDPDKRPFTGLDGLMAGYCLLERQKGPEFVLDFLTKKEIDFNVRYAALRITATFLLKDFPAPDRKMIFDRLGAVVDSDAIGDLVIDELRKAEVWQQADKIVSLYDKPELKDNQLIRRAALRYSLKCPNEAAKKFVARMKQEDPTRVVMEEENIKFEEIQAKAAQDDKQAETIKK